MIEIRSQLQVRVGETFSGHLIWTPPNQDLPKRAIASIGWRTEGRGTVNRETVQEIQLDFSKFSAGTIATVPWQFQIPFVGPASYDGSLLRVIWELTTVIDLPGLFTRNDQQVVMFRVLPR